MLERPQLRLKCYPSCDFYCRGNGGKGLKKKPVEKLAGKRAELYPGERELEWEKVFLAVGLDAFLVVLCMRWRLQSLVRDTSISAEPGEKPFWGPRSGAIAESQVQSWSR